MVVVVVYLWYISFWFVLVFEITRPGVYVVVVVYYQDHSTPSLTANPFLPPTINRAVSKFWEIKFENTEIQQFT